MESLTIANLSRVCRFCLKESLEMRPIFRHETADDVKYLVGGNCSGNAADEISIAPNEEIVEMIDKCIGLETSYADGLPMYLCNDCYQQLRNSYEFRKQCISTVECIKNILKDQEINIKDENLVNEVENTIYFSGSNNFSDVDNIDHVNSVNNNNNQNNQTIAEESIIIEASIEDIKDNITTPTTTIINASIIMPTLDRRKTQQKSKMPAKNLTKIKTEIIDTTTTMLGDELKPKRKRDRDRLTKRLQKLQKDNDKEKKPRIRHRNKPEQCDICGFISRSLKSHMLVHTQVKNYECDFCGKKFSLRASLKNHIFAHINIRPFKCTLCHQTFITSCKRKNHMITHTGERNFSCSVCGKRFAQSGPRDVHLLTHSQIREHKCEYCGKLFLLKHQLRNHIGIHTGERSYACGLCPMTFINSSGVSSHRRIHKEKNEYRCQICQMKIKELRFLKIHVKEHLPKILVKPVIAPTDPHEELVLKEDPIYDNYTKITKEIDFQDNSSAAQQMIEDNFFAIVKESIS